MSIGKIAGKYDLSVVARVASEDPDEEISVFKKRFKNMKAAMSAYNYMVNDFVDNPIIVALKSAGFFTTTFGSKNNPNEPVYIGMRIARTLGTNANVAVWKISGYIDGRTMVIAHATAQPESAIEEDYKSNGPITRALAAHHAAQAR